MLAEKQYLLMELIFSGKTQAEAAEILGVSDKMVRRWMADENWDKEYRAAIRNHAKTRLKDVVDAMIEAAVQDRNAAAAKLILQMNGLLQREPVEVIQPITVRNEIDLNRIREELRGI